MNDDRTPLQKLKAALRMAEYLEEYGWSHVPSNDNNFIFEKKGKKFDLSAANMYAHERIFNFEIFKIN